MRGPNNQTPQQPNYDSSRVDTALHELSRVSSTDALAILHAIDRKRREEHYIRYFTPYPAQAKILSEFKNQKIFGILGGNRSGKTELGAFIALAWALGKEYFENEPAYEYIKDLPIPPGPKNIWIVGLDFATVRDIIWYEKFKTGRNHPAFLPRDPAVVRKANDGDFQIFFENGSIITCKSADSGREKFQGASVDLVWIDEEPEVEIFDECYQRTVDCAGKILLTLTPLTDISSGVRTPWVFDLYEDWKIGKKDVHFCQLSFLDNPYVPQAEKELAKEKWAGHPEEGARLYGNFVQRSGLVYPMWDAAKHIVRIPTVPRDWTRVVCIDPAPTGVTAAVWCAVDPEGNLLFYKEYYERDRIVSDHAKSLKIVNSGDPVDIWLIDPKGGSQRNAETHKNTAQLYREAGIPVRLAEVGEDYGRDVFREYLNATVTEGARHPKAWMTDQLPNARFEMEHYVYAQFTKGEMKGLSKERPVKRHDHAMNCMQYISALRPRFRRKQAASSEQQLQFSRTNSYT